MSQYTISLIGSDELKSVIQIPDIEEGTATKNKKAVGKKPNQNDNWIPKSIEKDTLPNLRKTGLVQHDQGSQHRILCPFLDKCRQT